MFDDWLRQLLERAPQVLASAPRGQSAEKQLEQKVEALEEKLKRRTPS